MLPSSTISRVGRCFFQRTIGLLVVILQLPFVLVTSFILSSYGAYMLARAVISDFSNEFEQPCSTQSMNASTPPIVLVHGVLGFGEEKMGRLSNFTGVEKKYEKIFVPDLGSFTSIYDRARQLFYYLKGGQVDYGEEHSRACGHSQYGRVYKQGKYPEWDEDHPIHFVGHSAGAQVVRVLQQMLADKAFKGHANTSGNWVASLTSLCGAFNGSTKAYIMGMKPEDWKRVKPISVLQICCLGIILYDWLDISWMKSYYNFGFDHFNISWRKTGVRGLVDCLLGNAGPFASGDWVLPDTTIPGSMHINSQLTTFPNTFYFSYTAKLTKRVRGFIVPTSIPEMNPWFFFEVFLMSLWRYPTDLPPPYEGYRDEDWWDNDGVLNTISMTHPSLPNEHPHQLVADELNLQPRPGIWYYKTMEAYHSQFLTNAGTEGNQFSQLYDTVFKRCRQLVIKKSPVMVLQDEDD